MATTNTRIFSDFDLSFLAHPVTSDLIKVTDEDAIKQAVKILVLSNHYERPFHSDIGSSVRALLFEPASNVTAQLIRRSIMDVVINYEQRVELIDVVVQFDDNNNAFNVTIIYKIIGMNIQSNVSLILERTR